MANIPENSGPISTAEDLFHTVRHIFGQASSEVNEKDIFDAKKRVQQLCLSIMKDVAGPAEYTILLAESCHESAALHLVTELRVADVIGEGTKSLSDIAQEVKVDARYIGAAMNCLLRHGYFEEVPGSAHQVFKNNSMSSVLREKSSDNLCDAIGFICDDGFKAAAYLAEAARASVPSGVQGAPAPAALNLALGFEGSVFKYWEDPTRVWRGKRMGQAMKQLHQMANANVTIDFNWQALISPLVDVGGGIGSLEMALTKAYPTSTLQFIIVDIPDTIKAARAAWASQSPDVQGRVTFVAGDFLAPTLDATRIPRGEPTYLIRHVLHDWTDEEVVRILKNVHAAMVSPPLPTTARSHEGDALPQQSSSTQARTPKLLLCEMVLREDSGRFAYTTSIQVLALNNGIVRTEKEMYALLAQAGFRVVATHTMRAVDTIIEAVPAAV
ncbi:S-adenosyl-L-methionine-dependent methyltransferase [Cubamyces sp. BRFM 1775]|nr:S-adenosyl-L-methionine-dependent methyltransferase [Cubamyces sp. BRFM 1775]